LVKARRIFYTRLMAKVLVIEDDGELQQLISTLLNREGYETHYAFNGKEGLERMLAVQPDVVLLDLMLPVLNGVEVIQQAATNTSIRDIPIIVMTGHGDKADLLETKMKDGGVRAYLRKPFDLGEMKSLVRRMLAQYPRDPITSAHVAKGSVRLDVKFRTVWIDDRMVSTLSPTKALLLQTLLEARGAVTREKLLKAVWGSEGTVPALEKTVQRLREDLGPEGGKRLQTTSEGYELVG
jgi:DNA-binding response OmpR family regulator